MATHVRASGNKQTNYVPTDYTISVAAHACLGNYAAKVKNPEQNVQKVTLLILLEAILSACGSHIETCWGASLRRYDMQAQLDLIWEL